MLRIFIFLSILSVVFIACERDDKNLELDFSGITETGLSGESLSAPDADDWNFDDNWNTIERGLFSVYVDDICEMSEYEYNITAYPNPCDDVIFIHLAIPEDKSLTMKIVDEELNVLYEANDLTTGVKVNISTLGINNKIVRAYYKIIGDDCELRGHGDIKVN